MLHYSRFAFPHSILFGPLIALLSLSCNDDSYNPCVKGKYLGQYCGGAVIEIIDGHSIGRNLESIFGDKKYENCLLASIDSTLIKQGQFPGVFASGDSVFYFFFKDGGYARKQYNNCQPVPFVTITSASGQPCLHDDRIF